ncbi:RidA family protein [Halopenitus sp. H-Gu1]|uniref:RidA family protein n=1 Tax=Halopenitus sp. H-Gu1 TaxID=3242697 RepID=UPI00359EF031
MPDELYDSTDKQYVHAIVADGTLYVSGQIATDPEGNVVGDTIQAQSRQAFENVGAILDEVDLGFEDVVKVKSFLVDIHGDYDEYKAVFADVFDEPLPCHTMIGVEDLATEELLVELEIEAPLPAEQT